MFPLLLVIGRDNEMTLPFGKWDFYSLPSDRANWNETAPHWLCLYLTGKQNSCLRSPTCTQELLGPSLIAREITHKNIKSIPPSLISIDHTDE
jgi:hypothetical protein